MNSKITIHDSQSDITFVGKISKPFKLVGKFFDCNSNDIGYVSGSITKGVNWKDGRNLINAIEHQDTVFEYHQEDLIDLKYYKNVWGNVFELMEDKKYADADKERLQIIQKHLLTLASEPYAPKFEF